MTTDTVYTPSKKELRDMIVSELSLEGLTESKQDSIISTVTQALLDRAAIAVMSRLPAETIGQLSVLPPDEQADAIIKEAYAANSANLSDVVANAFREGIEKYKVFLSEESRK